jgi:predicted amidophosphoribosyltransferase
MKYGSGKSVAVMMGEIIACLFEVPDADFLVPVPLHKGSVREYNQTELIAKGASNVWGIPVKNSLRWRVVRDSQASSPDLESRNLSSDAMEAIVEVKLDGVFIVDDVCTTGNTLIAAAAALRSAGASVGGALVWSRGI